MAEKRTFKKKVFLKETQSTNLYVEEMLADDSSLESTVVQSDFQSVGSGHADNQWESEKGKNCLVSFYMPQLHIFAAQQFVLSKITCLAVVSTLHSIMPQSEIRIKWPNDIYIGDKKVAGVLIKNKVQNQHVISSIIGVGVNVNQDSFLSSAPNPISVKSVVRKDIDISMFLNELTLNIEEELDQLMAKGSQIIDERFHNLLYSLDAQKKYEINSQVEEGIVRGVDEYGRLKLEVRGQISYCDFKEVKLVL